jgi:hypothetical protein
MIGNYGNIYTLHGTRHDLLVIFACKREQKNEQVSALHARLLPW